MFFLCILPDPLIAARLELRHAASGSSDISALVGDLIDVDVWVDSENQRLSGAAVFLTFDEELFELVSEDRDPGLSGFQPFALGSFLRNGEIFRNALLDPDDPAASLAGAQLDYSVVRASDQGAGPAASFRLRARAPVAESIIRIDETGIRETRFFRLDGSNASFRFITPMRVTVRGIGIEGLPDRLVLSRGQVDSTTFRLDNFIFDPIYGNSEISWSISPTSSLSIQHDTDLNVVWVTAPESESPWERLTLTAVNPNGQSASATVDVFVNEAPRLPDRLDPIQMQEDEILELELDDLVHDEDTPLNQLRWSASAPKELAVSFQGPPRVARIEPQQNWSGSGEIVFIVVDDFDFADTSAVAVTVSAVNDSPRMLAAPNITLIRGRQDSSLVLFDLVADAEDTVDDLELSWSGGDHIALHRSAGRLIVVAPPEWLGTESIQLEARDSGGLAATIPLTVTVIRSLPPAFIDPPDRLGMTGGDDVIVELATLVVDPDDPTADLEWRASGQDQLAIQLSSSGAARIEAPEGFEGSETVRFEVSDPSGEAAFFELLVFAASPGGEPAIAPLPGISVPVGGVDASIDLDEYLFDIDHNAGDMEWFLPAVVGVEMGVDPETHVLTVAVSDSAEAGILAVELRVRDPDGHESAQMLSIGITSLGESTPDDPGVVLPVEPAVLASLPSLTLTAGGFDQSIVLDDYLTGADPASLTWEVTGQRHTQVLIDPESRRVTVLADADWNGAEILIIRGLDAFGNVVEGLLGLQILAAPADLSLRELTEVSVLAGDSQFELDLGLVLEGEGNAAGLEWEIRGSRQFDVTFDIERNTLIVVTEGIVLGDEALTLVATDQSGSELTGMVVVHGLAADGSVGTPTPDLRIAVVPNPIQPDYLDLFVLSDLPGSRRPRLRLQHDGWTDLAIDDAAPGIWWSSHVLPADATGDIFILALTMEGEEVLKTDFTLSRVAPLPASAKPVAQAAERSYSP